MSDYHRPLPQCGPARPRDALPIAGGWAWFTHVERLSRISPPEIIHASEVPAAILETLTRARPPIVGMSFERPRVMGILNATPDSFSDGGKHHAVADALAGARAMAGCDMLDVGGESTRPGAATLSEDEEIARVVPVIRAIRAAGLAPPVSIDTRKASVARAALEAGAVLVNDVSGFSHDADLAPLCAEWGVPVCVMHMQGDPATMQQAPAYDDVLLDVYDHLAGRIAWLVARGIRREHIIADPGIGFGKTLEHNLALLARLSLFHGLGVPILLGASRKRFIGTIGGAEEAAHRVPGSLAVAVAALQHGTQIVRVHDVPETVQAIALWRAVMAGERDG